MEKGLERRRKRYAQIERVEFYEGLKSEGGAHKRSKRRGTVW